MPSLTLLPAFRPIDGVKAIGVAAAWQAPTQKPAFPCIFAPFCVFLCMREVRGRLLARARDGAGRKDRMAAEAGTAGASRSRSGGSSRMRAWELNLGVFGVSRI